MRKGKSHNFYSFRNSFDRVYICMREWTFHVKICDSNMSFGMCIHIFFPMPIDTTSPPERAKKSYMKTHTSISTHSIPPFHTHSLTHTHTCTLSSQNKSKTFVSNCVIALNYPLEEFACRRITQWLFLDCNYHHVLLLFFNMYYMHHVHCACNTLNEHAKRNFLFSWPVWKKSCTQMWRPIWMCI